MMKRRLGLLGVVVLVAALVAAIVWQWGEADKRHRQQFARLVLAQELTVRHMKGMEPDQRFADYFEDMTGKLLAASEVGASWTAKFIPREKRDAVELTEPERAMLQAIEAGAKEAWEYPTSHVVRYMRLIEAKRSCQTCHSDRPNASAKPAPTGYVVSLEVTRKAAP
jgi:hypothetical protein